MRESSILFKAKRDFPINFKASISLTFSAKIELQRSIASLNFLCLKKDLAIFIFSKNLNLNPTLYYIDVSRLITSQNINYKRLGNFTSPPDLFSINKLWEL